MNTTNASENGSAGAAAAELMDEFAFLDDWEDRYRHVIDLGKALSPLQDQEKSEETRVSGCASQVWLVVEPRASDAPAIQIRGDSDAQIVRGLLAVLARLYTGMSPRDAAAFDAETVFSALNLQEHLSAQRANGLRSMIQRIRHDASALSANAPN